MSLNKETQTEKLKPTHIEIDLFSVAFILSIEISFSI